MWLDHEIVTFVVFFTFSKFLFHVHVLISFSSVCHKSNWLTSRNERKHTKSGMINWTSRRQISDPNFVYLVRPWKGVGCVTQPVFLPHFSILPSFLLISIWVSFLNLIEPILNPVYYTLNATKIGRDFRDRDLFTVVFSPLPGVAHARARSTDDHCSKIFSIPSRNLKSGFRSKASYRVPQWAK